MNTDKKLLESLVKKYGANKVANAIKNINESSIRDELNEAYEDLSASLGRASEILRRMMIISDEDDRNLSDGYAECWNDLRGLMGKVFDVHEAGLKFSLHENLNESEDRFWCGVPDVIYRYYGDWNDPEVEYNGYICKEWDIQDSMYQFMKERIADGEEWGDPENTDDFCKFCQAHADQVQQDIMEFAENDPQEDDIEGEIENADEINKNALVNDIHKLMDRDYNDMNDDEKEEWLNKIVFDGGSDFVVDVMVDDLCEINDIDPSDLSEYIDVIKDEITKYANDLLDKFNKENE